MGVTYMVSPLHSIKWGTKNHFVDLWFSFIYSAIQSNFDHFGFIAGTAENKCIWVRLYIFGANSMIIYLFVLKKGKFPWLVVLSGIKKYYFWCLDWGEKIWYVITDDEMVFVCVNLCRGIWHGTCSCSVSTCSLFFTKARNITFLYLLEDNKIYKIHSGKFKIGIYTNIFVR